MNDIMILGSSRAFLRLSCIIPNNASKYFVHSATASSNLYMRCHQMVKSVVLGLNSLLASTPYSVWKFVMASAIHVCGFQHVCLNIVRESRILGLNLAASLW